MKRRDLVRHLEQSGCVLKREGGNHSVFIHPEKKTLTAVPRHNEIKDFLVIKICRDLEISNPFSR